MSEKKLDILNREDFITLTIELVKLISSHKDNMTFAITGDWGCGKTFVLEEIERRLSEDKSAKYLVIHYNCWQYDYYDEPLVALVSALNDFADSTKTIPEDTKVEIKEIVTKVGANLFTQVVKNKLGVDIGEAFTTAKEAIDNASASVAERHGYDAYFGFKSALTALKLDLQELAKKYTLVFAVDELDRCLPEYAIKVLERLHHITEELPNTITILAVDKKRLENTVTSIFGEGNATDYLKKFVRFEISLNKGLPSGKEFFTKFKSFYDRFDPSLYGQLKNSERFLTELFGGIDARAQEHIVEKATIFNDVCFGPEKQDHSMMYMELFMATLYYHFHDDSIFEPNKTVSSLGNPFGNCTIPANLFKDDDSGFRFDKRHPVHGFYLQKMLIDESDIYMITYMYWYHAMKRTKDPGRQQIYPGTTQRNDRIEENIDKLQKNVELLKIIG